MRDKLISIRCSSDKVKKCLDIIKSNTIILDVYNHKIYRCSLGKQFSLSNKVSLADIFDNAMDEFILKNSNTCKK